MGVLVNWWQTIKRGLGVEALNRALYRRGFRDLPDPAYAVIWATLWVVLILVVLLLP